ncbi:hypothetical protein ACGFZB_28770 [Streptomyces cinerochromogenes]|uniref:Uncharacterized protein n=1 Tax=Streptomyces cinerochromogenes TaxID=66422 RepID=A0ABW7BAV6_9ACTN
MTFVREPDTVIVHALPDQEPVTFDKARCVYAYWVTEELMRETEEG